MQIVPGPGEPVAGPWRSLTVAELARLLLGPVTSAASDGPRRVVAVDGRSGAGKTTLARRLQEAVPAASLVHTDDLAWWEPMFGWAGSAADGVLQPFREGREVRYRPPAWEARDRPGCLEVPLTTRVLLCEGVGASQAALGPLLDVRIWVQSDFAAAERRGIARDFASGVNGGEAESIAFWHEWMADETPFLAADRPWERADVIVAGVLEPMPADERLLVSEGPGWGMIGAGNEAEAKEQHR